MLTELEKWEQRLDALLDEIDDLLEDQYEGTFMRHPVRKRRGETARKSQDGIIELKSNFTLGLGSEKGEGYVIVPRVATLEAVPDDVKSSINQFVCVEIQKRLPLFFPKNELSCEWDGRCLKIYGDLDFTH